MLYIESMRPGKTKIIPITDDFMFKAVFSDRNLLYDLLNPVRIHDTKDTVQGVAGA